MQNCKPESDNYLHTNLLLLLFPLLFTDTQPEIKKTKTKQSLNTKLELKHFRVKKTNKKKIFTNSTHPP